MQTKCSDTAGTTIPSLLSIIKQELHANMNGIASAAMRQTGDYRLNWGIELPRLEGIAKEFGKNQELAQALWKESVRECRILATMIQPAETFSSELAEVWVEQIRTNEIAQIASLNLFQYMPSATDMAFHWIASDNEMEQICGLSILSHILRKHELQDRAVDELRDQAKAVAESANLAIRKMANNILLFLQERYE